MPFLSSLIIFLSQYLFLQNPLHLWWVPWFGVFGIVLGYRSITLRHRRAWSVLLTTFLFGSIGMLFLLEFSVLRWGVALFVPVLFFLFLRFAQHEDLPETFFYYTALGLFIAALFSFVYIDFAFLLFFRAPLSLAIATFFFVIIMLLHALSRILCEEVRWTTIGMLSLFSVEIFSILHFFPQTLFLKSTLFILFFAPLVELTFYRALWIVSPFRVRLYILFTLCASSLLLLTSRWT